MRYKPKTAGLLLFTAILIIGAAAPAASMADEFVVEEEKKVTVTGEQILGTVTGLETSKHEFKTDAGVLKCTPTTFDGVLEGSSGSLTLTPTYGNTAAGTGCTLAGIAGPVVHMRSCDYLLTAGETVEGSESKIGVIPHIRCTTSGDKIEITAFANCMITVPEQSFAESMVTAENSGGAGTEMDLKLIIDITGISYLIDGNGCPNDATGPATKTNGTYKGVATLKADEFANNANKVGLSVGEAPPPPTSEFVVEEEKKVTVTGEQILGTVTGLETSKHEFKTDAGVLKCTPTTFDGVLEGSSGRLTLTPTYGNTAAGTGCTLAGIAGPVVHMRSCDYLLTAGETVEGSESKIGVIPHIRCTTSGDKIEITAFANCMITVPEQSFAESMVTAENSGGAGTEMDLKLIIDITGISYLIDGNGCPNDATGPATKTNGTYKGVATLKADEFANNANKVGLSVGEAPPPPTSEFVVEEEKKVTVTGEQILGTVTGLETSKHEFKTDAGVLKCTPTTFDGVLEGSSGSLTLTPTYGNTAAGTGCTLAGIAGPVVHMRSCDYLLTAGETVEGSESKIGVIPHIRCTTSGDKIEITAFANCMITVPEQSFAESMVTAENSGGAGTEMDLKLIIDITGISYLIDGNGCPNDATGPATKTNGTYKGVATLKADEFANNANKVGLTVK